MTGKLTRFLFSMHTDPHLKKPALIYRTLGNERRLRILELLTEEKYSGEELAEKLMISPPAVSKHLHVLIRAGLIRGKRIGVSVKFELEKNIDIKAIRDVNNLLTKRLIH